MKKFLGLLLILAFVSCNTDDAENSDVQKNASPVPFQNVPAGTVLNAGTLDKVIQDVGNKDANIPAENNTADLNEDTQNSAEKPKVEIYKSASIFNLKISNANHLGEVDLIRAQEDDSPVIMTIESVNGKYKFASFPLDEFKTNITDTKPQDGDEYPYTFAFEVPKDIKHATESILFICADANKSGSCRDEQLKNVNAIVNSVTESSDDAIISQLRTLNGRRSWNLKDGEPNGTVYYAYKILIVPDTKVNTEYDIVSYDQYFETLNNGGELNPASYLQFGGYSFGSMSHLGKNENTAPALNLPLNLDNDLGFKGYSSTVGKFMVQYNADAYAKIEGQLNSGKVDIVGTEHSEVPAEGSYKFLGFNFNNLKYFAQEVSGQQVVPPFYAYEPPTSQPTPPPRTTGCFIEGTQIKVDKNRSDAVENLKIGDLIVDGNNKPVVIDNIVVGPEKELVYYFTTEKGTIGLTKYHPILAESGIKMAKDLALGEKVFAEKNELLRINKIQKKSYGKNVYNILINETDKKESSHLLSANGLISGDLYLQEKYSKKILTTTVSSK